MKMSDSLFQPGPANDSAYVNVRDKRLSGGWAAAKRPREFCEELWDKYRPYADSHFLSDAKDHFQQRFWEMYLGATLLRKGFKIVKCSDEGPEFYFMSGKRKVWVEAVAPGPGEGPDAVPEQRRTGVVYALPQEQILLRYTHALVEKLKRYKKAVDNGIIGANDCYVVAVNGHGVYFGPPCHAEGSAPLWVRACLPFGDYALEIDKKTREIVGTFHQYRDGVNKRNMSPVSTKPLLEPEYAGISGILHSAVDPVNRPGEMGDDFEFLHNPLASQPIERSAFSFWRQYSYFPERGELQTIEPNQISSD